MAVGNTFQTVDWVCMETLRLLKNKLQVAQFFNSDFGPEYTKEYAVGETIRVKLPQRFTIRDGMGYTPQAINRIYTTVTVDQAFGVDFEFDSIDQALNMERGEEALRREYAEPAAAQMAQEIDSRAALWAYQNTNNIVGALGTDPTDMTTFGGARQRLLELACPPGGKRGVVIPPQVNTSMVNAMKGLFQDSDALSKQYKEGTIGRYQGFDWYESMSLYSHTAGTWAGSVTVSGASQSGSSLVVNCTNGDTFKKGDKISIDNVYAVNPMTRRTTTTATDKQFTILEDVTASGSTATLSISPAIYGPGSQYQNVDALPANGATITLFPGTSSPNGKSGKVGLAIHRDAFALVGVKLMMPKAVEIARQMRDPETGISVSFIRAFDPIERKMINRFDTLIGFGNLYPDNCSVGILSA